MANDTTARLLPHFKRLHQVGHAHFLQPALNDARTRSALLQFFQVDAVDDFFRDAHKIFQQERFRDEVFDAIHQGTKAFFNVAPAGHEEKRNVPRLLAAPKFFKQLASIKAGHLVVAQNRIRRLVDHFEQRVAAVRCKNNFAVWLQALLDQVADKRIILGDQQTNRFCGMGGHERLAERLVPFQPF